PPTAKVQHRVTGPEFAKGEWVAHAGERLRERGGQAVDLGGVVAKGPGTLRPDGEGGLLVGRVGHLCKPLLDRGLDLLRRFLHGRSCWERELDADNRPLRTLLYTQPGLEGTPHPGGRADCCPGGRAVVAPRRPPWRRGTSACRLLAASAG